jgi:hypothetical protein
MAIYLHGTVTCRHHHTATVQLTTDEREQLLAGRLPCPCCGEPCSPSFRVESAADASASMSWRSGKWLAAIEER